MRLDRLKFRTWLKTKHPDEIVGTARNCTTCPIAVFYRENTGCEIDVVNNGDVHCIDRGNGLKQAPAWASNFIHHVDEAGAVRISARRAIEILNAYQ